MELLFEQGINGRNGEIYNWGMATTDLKTFGERVAQLLRQRKASDSPIASQKELAAAMRIKPQYLSALMSGKRTPNVQHLRAAATALETSVSYLALATDDPSPDDDTDAAAHLAAQLAAHDAAIAKHVQALKRADDAYMAGVKDLDWLRAQTANIKALIAAEQSAKTTLEAAADAAKQRGSRADMLREVAASGPAMLTTEDTATANAWLRRFVRVFVRDNQVTDVVFNFW